MGYQLWLPDYLSKWGVRFQVVRGYETRGSSSFAPKGHVCHHTASSRRSGPDGALNICIAGRAGVPGPLCNTHLNRDGLWRVIAAGRANHAGRGGWSGLSGNGSVLGTEAENDGIGEPWAPRMLDSYHLGVAALMDGLKREVGWNCGHKEWTSRKPDPHPLDMRAFRARVAQLLQAGPGEKPREDDDVIRPGDTGPQVVELQHDVNRLIELTAPWPDGHLQVDGVYGPKTVERTQHALWRAKDWVLRRTLYADASLITPRTHAVLLDAIREMERRAAA